MAADLDVERVRARAKSAYERGRLRDASFIAAWLLPLAFVVGLCEHEVRTCSLLGLALAALVASYRWRGGELARGIVPGVVAGLAPLVLANLARSTHVCIGGSCTTACVVACSFGGVVAGLASAWFARRTALSPTGALAAASLALLVGALGCVCVGVFGVVGLVAGLAVGWAPWIVRPAMAR